MCKQSSTSNLPAYLPRGYSVLHGWFMVTSRKLSEKRKVNREFACYWTISQNVIRETLTHDTIMPCRLRHWRKIWFEALKMRNSKRNLCLVKDFTINRKPPEINENWNKPISCITYKHRFLKLIPKKLYRYGLRAELIQAINAPAIERLRQMYPCKEKITSFFKINILSHSC